MWVASRTHPDIAGSVPIVATVTTFHPYDGFNFIKGMWGYLATTDDYYMECGSLFVPQRVVNGDLAARLATRLACK